MNDIVGMMVLAGFGEMTDDNRAVMERALAAIEGGCDWEFSIGDTVEKYTGEAGWHGIVVSRYLTSKGKRRYVIDVLPQGFQMIAVPNQLRRLSERGPALTTKTLDETAEFQGRAKEIITRLRLAPPPPKG